MLQTFRDRLQGWVITIIVTLIVLGLGLFGLQNYWSSSASKVVATVDDHKIFESQLNKAYEQARLHAEKSNLKGLDSTFLKKQILSSLVHKQLELKSALKLGMKISPEQLQAFIYSIPFLKDDRGVFSYQKFQQFLALSQQSEATFLSEVKTLALINQLKMGIIETAFVLKEELVQMVALVKQTRIFDYLVIPHSIFNLKTPITREAIEAYYEKNSSQFKVPERVKVDYLLLDPSDIKKEITVSDAEIKKHYEENKALYPGKDLMAAGVRDQIKQILFSEKLQSKLLTLSDQLEELTYTHSDSLNAASQALKLPIRTSDFFSREGGAGFFKDPAIIQAAFNLEVLTQGRNSELLRLKNGALLVLRMKEHEPSKVLPLELVKNQIESKLATTENHEQAKKLGQEWLNMLKEGKDIKSLINAKNLNWKPANAKEFKAVGVDQDIVNTAFEIPPSTKQDTLAFAGKSLPNGNFVLIRLKSVELGDLNSLKEDVRLAFKKRLEEIYSQQEYHFYLEGLLKRATVKIQK